MDQRVLPELLIVGDGDVGTKGIVHMNTRQNIRRRVCSIEVRTISTNIFSLAKVSGLNN